MPPKSLGSKHGVFEKRALVLDPECQSMMVKKTKNLELANEEYVILTLPSKSNAQDCWDIYKEDDKIWVTDARQQSTKGYYVGRLNLERLGLKNQFFRKHGVLDMVYVAKHLSPM